MNKQPFSSQLDTWLRNSGPKNLRALTDTFAEKSFAIAILLLMFIPALPIPTAGVTHIFEVITMLLALEMIVGRRSVWLPKKFQAVELGGSMLHKAIPFIGRRIRWFEKFSRPRFRKLLDHRYFLSIVGVIVFIFALASALAPPFSGLDTLPAMGAVVVALSLILEDVVIFGIGCIVGTLGIWVEIGLGAVIVTGIKHLFR